MPVAQNDVIRVAAKGEFDFAEDIINVFHWKAATIVDGSDNQVGVDIVGAVEDMYAAVGGSLSNKLIWDSVSIINQTTDTFIGEFELTLNMNGAGEVVPMQVAALVIGRTAKPRVQGRKYLGPLVEGGQADGVVTAAVLAELDSFANKYVTNWAPVSGNDWDPGVVKLDAQGAIVEFNPFTQGKALAALRTQRRRTKGRGS